jgi:hypothetical protein
MSHLSPEAEQLLAETRQLDEPTLADRARLRARLDASWSAGSSVGGASAGAKALSAAGKLWLSGTGFVALAGVGLWLNAAPAATTSTSSTVEVTRGQLVTQPTAAVSPVEQADGSALAAAFNDLPGADSQLRVHVPTVQRTALATATSSDTVPRSKRARGAKAADAARNAVAATQANEVAAAVGGTPEADAPEPTSTRTDEARVQQAERARQRTAAADAKRPTKAVDEREEAFVPDAIGDEVSLLGAAQAELSAGQPSRALGYVRQHAFRFPTGALAQERLAVHVLALCALDRKNAARQVFEDLTHRAPSAAVITRLRHECGF